MVQAGALIKAKKDIGHTMGDLGLAFIKLTKFETEEAIHNSQKIRADETRCFGTAAVKACRFYRESNAQIEKHLVIDSQSKIIMIKVCIYFLNVHHFMKFLSRTLYMNILD